MTGCTRCDRGWITHDDGAVSRCACMTAPDTGPVVAAMATDLPALHRGASVAQQMTTDSLTPQTLSRRRADTLRRVADHPDGVTCDRLEVLHGTSHQSQSAVLNWLEQQGLVARGGDRRRTRSGRWADPYHVTPLGRATLRSTTT